MRETTTDAAWLDETSDNWASEASPTLGGSIEILRDIYLLHSSRAHYTFFNDA